MKKSLGPLPLRQAHRGKWEIENVTGKWIKCETEADGKVLSDAPS